MEIKLNRKSIKKSVLLAVMTVGIFSLSGCTSKNTNLEKYLNTGDDIDKYASDVMPQLSELGDYDDIDFQYYKVKTAFETQSIVLVVEYDANIYEEKKQEIESKYIYLDHTIESDDGSGDMIIPENEFTMDGFQFKVIDDSYCDSIEYPKSFGMVGTSDDMHRIAYLYFYDPSLDVITGVSAGVYEEDQKMEYFVNTYFAYEFDIIND
ncbi:MAG: hypothetical protein ACI4DS_04045 [Eubacterium sp.]